MNMQISQFEFIKIIKNTPTDINSLSTLQKQITLDNVTKALNLTEDVSCKNNYLNGSLLSLVNLTYLALYDISKQNISNEFIPNAGKFAYALIEK